MKKVVVHDLMQDGYVYWRTEPIGRNFAPGFAPALTPKQMLRLGVFGGKYMTDCTDEFPADWFVGARLCSERHDPRLNYFGVNASQSLAVWRRNGWIHKQDPRGWFQWLLPVLHGPAERRRRAADSPLAGDRSACDGDTQELRAGRPRVPQKTAAGRAPLGVRQPKDLGTWCPPSPLSYVVSAFRRTGADWLNQAI